MSQEKNKVTEEIDAAKPSQGFWSDAWQRYRRRPIGMLALGFVLFLTFVALFAPAIAGTKPVICSYKGDLYFPCLGYFNRSWESPIFTKDKFRGTYPKNLQQKDPKSWAVWPLVFQDPYRRVRENEWPGRRENPSRDEGHPNRLNLFGTDQYGVDIFAKMVHGTTIALLVGFVLYGSGRFHWRPGRSIGWLFRWLGRHDNQSPYRDCDVYSNVGINTGSHCCC